jgi:hypothetical protein
MKNLFFLLISALILSLSACDKDEDCEPGELNTNIVGEWNVKLEGLSLAQVEFRANGDFVDQSGFLVPDEIAGITVETKTYTIPSNVVIRMIASNSLGSVNYDVDVISYTCDEIVVDVNGTEYTLERRD